MFRAEKITPKYSNLLGWRQHHDTNEIAITNSLTVTESGEYFQQKHPAMRLDLIKSILPDNLTLDKYLEQRTRDGSVEMLNDIFQYRQVNEYGRTLLKQSQLLNKYGWVNDKIVNESRFVGYQIRLMTGSGVQAVINKIGFQFATAETFDVYLFHSSKEDFIAKKSITTTGNGGWNWSDTEFVLPSFDDEINGGAFVIGYYQDDVTGNAINNTDFNFDSGPCGGCGDVQAPIWNQIKEYFLVYPFYVPSGSYTREKMFDMDSMFYTNTVTYGMNLRMTTMCDLTQFFIDNKFAFKNLLAYRVVLLVLNDMKFSQEINYIEENLKSMIIRDLEGDTETKEQSLTKKYRDELKAVSFNISGINEKCLPCSDENTAPEYGVV